MPLLPKSPRNNKAPTKNNPLPADSPLRDKDNRDEETGLGNGKGDEGEAQTTQPPAPSTVEDDNKDDNKGEEDNEQPGADQQQQEVSRVCQSQQQPPAGKWELSTGDNGAVKFVHSGTASVKTELTNDELEEVLEDFEGTSYSMFGAVHKRRPEDQDRVMKLVPKFIAGMYKRRYLKLIVTQAKGPTLHYFQGKASAEPKGSVDVQNIMKVDTHVNDGPTSFPINITTTTRKYFFSVDTLTEQKLWKAALSKVLNKLSLDAIMDVFHKITYAKQNKLNVAESTVETMDFAQKLTQIREKAEEVIKERCVKNVLLAEDYNEYGRSGLLMQPHINSSNASVKNLLEDAKLANKGFVKCVNDVMSKVKSDLKLDYNNDDNVIVDGKEVYGWERDWNEDKPYKRFSLHPLMSEDQCKKFIDEKYQGEVGRCCNVLKSIVVVDSEEEWAAVTKGLLDGGKVVRLKNRFKEPKFTGIREMTLSLAVPLPSNSILGGVSKKKSHTAEVTVILSHFLALMKEAQGPYNFFKENAYQNYLGDTATKFFAAKDDDLVDMKSFVLSVLEGDDWDLLETLDDFMSERMVKDWEVKMRSSTRLLELAESLNKDDEVMLGWAHELANAYENLNESGIAISLYEKVLQARDHMFGSKDRETLATVHNLAGVYRSKGELDTALDMYQDAVEKLQQAMGEARAENAQLAVRLQGDRDAALKKLQEEHEAHLNDREEMHVTEKSQLSSSATTLKKMYEEKVEGIQEESAKALSEKEAELVEKGEQSLRELEERLKAEHEKILVDTKEEAEKVIQEALKKQDEENKKVNEIATKTMKTTISEMTSSHDSLVVELKADQEKKVTEVMAENDAARTALIEELKSAREVELKKLEDDLKASHETMESELRASHERQVKEVANQDDQTLSTVRECLREEHLALRKNALDEQQLMHATAIEGMKRDHEAKNFELKGIAERELEEQLASTRREIDEMRRQHNEKDAHIETIKDEHSQVVEQHTRAISQLENEKEMHSTRLVEEHVKTVASVKQEHEELEKTLRAEHSQILTQVEAEKEEQLDKVLKTREASTADHQQKLEAMQLLFEETKATHTDNSKKMQRDYEESLTTLQAERFGHEDLKERLGGAFEEAKVAHAKELEGIRREHEEQIAAKMEAVQREFDEAKAAHARRSEEMQREHDEGMMDLKRSRAASTTGHEEFRSQVERDFEEAKISHEKEMEENQRQHDEGMALFTRHRAESMAIKAQDLSKEIEAVRASCSQMIAEIEQSHEREMAKVKAEHVRAMEDLIQEHEEAFMEVKTRRESVATKLERTFSEHASQLKTLQSEFECSKREASVEKSDLVRKHRKELEAFKKQNTTTQKEMVVKHEAELSSLTRARAESTMGHKEVETELAALWASHASEVKKLQETLIEQQRLHEQHSNEMEELNRVRALSSANHAMQLTNELNEMKTSFETELSGMKKDQARVVKEMEGELTEAVRDKESLAAERDKLQAEIDKCVIS
ncbi:hypothetical protein TrLO_g6505 [Triparma laevis f. longispina]|uniref:PH domain-containing protein n=1 Tax=Triparma laevis f. longispina TaxID=1714387 RepID=A0A9W7EHY0_9STRA|nr:hypothetical protein TrLO_g6505 [Triparma laevis f. longispina]